MGQDRLYLRGRIWWGWVYDLAGQRRDFSTRQRAKAAATLRLRDEERRAADPNYAGSTATLSDALRLLIEDRTAAAEAGRRSDATVEMYSEKAGVLTRLLESGPGGSFRPLPLASITATLVDGYISRRRQEWAVAPREAALDKNGNVTTPSTHGRHIKDGTIAKELTTLRVALKLARRRGLWVGDANALVPPGFSPAYKPRDRRLSQVEMHALLGTLTSDHAARVAFIVATSAEWIATERARDEDWTLRFVAVRGSKNANRARTVPIVSLDQRSLLEHALAHARGAGGMLFERWINVRRDLKAACDRVGIPHCTPNDLRRTCATWLRVAGVRPADIAPVLGHADSKMVERVYGRLTPQELADQLAAQMPGRTAAHLQRTHPENDGSDGLPGNDTGAEAPGILQNVAPRAGFEPATRGLTVPIQCWPKPRPDRENASGEGAIAAHLQLKGRA